MTNLKNLTDTFHRTVKLALDTGEARTLEQALQLFKGYKIQVVLGEESHRNPALQAAALTAVNCAARTFLGGVQVVGGSGPLALTIPNCPDMETAVPRLGGLLRRDIDPKLPTLAIGDTAEGLPDPLAIRAAVSGWSGGIGPARSDLRGEGSGDFTPAGVLAGALGVSELFQRVRGSNPNACRREIGLNLWRFEQDWRSPECGPPLKRLPQAMWLIGLGNLGQAYLWTLGLLPYGEESAELVLQDFDEVGESNLSTSLLTRQEILGQRKARAMAAWADARGFSTSVVERRFDRNFRVDRREPPVALVGVDRVPPRRALEDVGFDRIIEAGLGGGPSDYLGIDLHTFPASKPAREVWSDSDFRKSAIDQPAYRDLLERSADRCGMVRLAGRSVGAPFVGSVAASMVVAELIRLLLGDHRYEKLSCHLKDLASRTVYGGENWPPFNIGALDSKPS